MYNEKEMADKEKLKTLIYKYADDGKFIYNEAIKEFALYISYEFSLDKIKSLNDIEKIIDILCIK